MERRFNRGYFALPVWGLFLEGLIFRRGLCPERNFRLKIDWAGHILGTKFYRFPLFYFVFEDNFQVQAPRGAYIWRGDLTKGFLRYEFGGLIFGGAYTWRGLFSEFYGTTVNAKGQNEQAC